jgi:hypothetical protein
MSDPFSNNNSDPFMDGGGSSNPSATFSEIGASVTGVVTKVDQRDDTKPDGTVKTWPDGKPMAVQMVSAVHPQQAQLKGKSEANLRTVELPKDLGLTLAPMSDALRTQHKIAAGTSGVVVTEAKTNSTAWNRGIRTGDVILRVQGDAVTQPDEVTKLVDAQRTGGLDMVRMLVTGPSGTRWVSVLAMTKL